MNFLGFLGGNDACNAAVINDDAVAGENCALGNHGYDPFRMDNQISSR